MILRIDKETEDYITELIPQFINLAGDGFTDLYEHCISCELLLNFTYDEGMSIISKIYEKYIDTL